MYTSNINKENKHKATFKLAYANNVRYCMSFLKFMLHQ